MLTAVADHLTDPGADLALWASNGDRAALERVLAAAVDPAYAQAVRLLGRAADADDATQEALVQLVRSASRYDPARPFRPWLARLVHDACCRFLRSDRRRRRHEATHVMSPPPETEPSMDPEPVRAAVLELPEQLRAAVELHYFAGLSQGEAASALGISEGACATRLSRARERLRVLLQRRGLGTAAVGALAVLCAAPAPAAPPTLVSQIAAQAAANALPATTIPLTTLQTGVWFMTTKPLTTALIGCMMTAAATIPFAIDAGEAPTPIPAVMPPASVPFKLSPAAQALMPYLDPHAFFRLAVDLETLRPQVMRAKPLSLLADPRTAAAVQEMLNRFEAFLDSSTIPEQKFNLTVVASTCKKARALTLATGEVNQGRAGFYPSLLMCLDFGLDEKTILDAFAVFNASRRLPPGVSLPPSPPPIGLFTSPGMLGDVGFFGHDAERFVLTTSTPWLERRLTAPPHPAPPAPAWFRYEAGALLAQYATLSGPNEDPFGITSVLGPSWRTQQPVIEGTLGTDGDEIVGSVHISGSVPLSPLVPIALFAGGTARVPFGELVHCPMRKPQFDVPRSADRVASLAFALELPPPAAPFTTAITTWDRSSPTQPRDLLRSLLNAAWSGDLALELRPGAPLPKGALVLGLRPGTDPTEAVRQVAVCLQASQAPLDQPGPLPKTISMLTSAGQIAVTAFPDRMVVTWNAEIAEWPGIATAAVPAAAPAFFATIDLPAVARTWGPLLAMAVPAEHRHLLPPLPVLIEHLPQWRLTCDATPDGARCEERGLPLFFGLAGLVSLRSAGDIPRKNGRVQDPGTTDSEPVPQAGF